MSVCTIRTIDIAVPMAQVIRSIDFYDDLAKWTAIEVSEGIGQCVETVSSIDDRQKSMEFEESQDFFHIAARAQTNTLKSQLFYHHGRNRNRRGRTIHDTDQGNMAAPRCCLNGQGYSVPSDDIKDMVGAPSVGEPENDLMPCCVRTCIDNLRRGSQLFQACDLTWAS